MVKEWTDPADGEKEVFFRNLSSVIVDCIKSGPPNEWWLTWQLFVVFWGLDNYPVLVSMTWVPLVGSMLEWALTHLVLLVAVFAGKLIGLKSVYDQYTPGRRLTAAVTEDAATKGKNA